MWVFLKEILFNISLAICLLLFSLIYSSLFLIFSFLLYPNSASFLARSNNSPNLASLYLSRFKFSFVFLARCHLFYLWVLFFLLWAYFFPTNLIRALESNRKSGASAPSKSKKTLSFFVFFLAL